jgi:hypothetical protein
MFYEFLPFQVLMACSATLGFLNLVGLIASIAQLYRAKAAKALAEARFLDNSKKA